MYRVLIVLCAALLFAWGTGRAGIISIAGEKLLDVTLRDADRVEALTALFTTARGSRALLLSDGISGRIDRLQLSQATFDAALVAILGKDYVYETEAKGGAVIYRISNPAVEPVVLAPPEPEPNAQFVRLKNDIFSTVLTITPYTGDGSLRLGGGTFTRRQVQPVRYRTVGIRYTETVPFIIMNESFDPFGRIIRSPQIYYQTFGAGFDLNGSRIHSYFNDSRGSGRRSDHHRDSNRRPDHHRDSERGDDRERDRAEHHR